ncbi:hypothetical protein [Timonella sp. A28]|uniref:hypothetical protein n=1 Tax=Timonella sp. A28 TaxID=3442640 RepID=UPI003EC03D53
MPIFMRTSALKNSQSTSQKDITLQELQRQEELRERALRNHTEWLRYVSHVTR